MRFVANYISSCRETAIQRSKLLLSYDRTIETDIPIGNTRLRCMYEYIYEFFFEETKLRYIYVDRILYKETKGRY